MAGLSERSLAEARRLREAGNVREVTPARTFVVQGDHDTYTITVAAAGATCTCPAYGECSHRDAAILSLCEPEPARPSDRDAGGRPRLSTWYFRAALDANRDGVVLVRISLGKPRWAPRGVATAMPYIDELAPRGLFHIEGDTEFEARYRGGTGHCANQVTFGHPMSSLLLHSAARHVRRSCFLDTLT